MRGLFFFFLVLTILLESSAEDITAFVYAGCTQAKYQPGSPYQYNVNSLLSSLTNNAGLTPYNNNSSGDAPVAVYGLYQCRGDVSGADCQACVRSAAARLAALCIGAFGGAVQLQGCYIRIARDQFIGQLDKSIAFQKCGAAANGNIDEARDSALAALTAGAGGSYRISSASGIQGVAQCLGDLGPSQCTDCLATAADAVRANCGPAGSAALYLVKCYVKCFSTMDFTSTPIQVPDHHPTIPHVDQTSRVVAIVAGAMAGVVILYIIVLSLKSRPDDDIYDSGCAHHGKH